MNGIKDLVLGGVEGLGKAISLVVDKCVTTEKEKIEAQTQIKKVLVEFELELAKTQATVINTEIQGNFIQRSWRPILMLSFGFIIIYQYFISPLAGTRMVELPGQFWYLMEIGIGGYILGRTAEKITDSITK